MVEYKQMELSRKQKIGQQILAHHDSIRTGKITLMYTPRPETRMKEKACIIVSVSKKTAPKAVSRNYNKRVLRSLLQQSLDKDILLKYDWMWICKEPKVTKELRLDLEEKLHSIK